MAKIELKNISKIFESKNDDVTAVHNLSFVAEDGEFIVLVGPSGCGKTTVLRMIAGLEDITEGELLFDDKIVNNIEPKQRNIGMVFQEYALYPHLTVFDNIAFPLKILKRKNKEITKNEIKNKVSEIAEQLNLTELLKRKPKELSGGQRQRVALGRAIIRQPQLFLFDEPLSNLDAKLRIAMRQEIISLQKKYAITSIYVTHDQTEAMTMGTKIAVMKNGVLQQFDTPAEVYNNPTNTFVADFIGTPHINFFEGTVREMYFNEKESDLKINKELLLKNKNMLIQNGNCTLAIRPENIFLEKNIKYNENTFEFETIVDDIEFLGNELIVYFTTGKTQKKLRTSIKKELKVGSKILCYFNTDDILFFDGNGNRIKTTTQAIPGY